MFRSLSTVLGLLLISLLVTACSSESTNDSETETDDELQVEDSTTMNPFDFEFTEKLPQSKLDYYHTLTDDQLRPEFLKSEGSFLLYAHPLDYGFTLLGDLDDYYAKKYTDSEIRDAFRTQSVSMSGKTVFILSLGHVGGYNNSDSREINDKFYEYFFLENESGDYVRASYQEKDLFTDKVDWLNDNVQVIISFNTTEVEKMMEDHEKMYLTFDGLDLFADNSIEILYPISEYYSKDFPEIVTMLEDMGF